MTPQILFRKKRRKQSFPLCSGLQKTKSKLFFSPSTLHLISSEAAGAPSCAQEMARSQGRRGGIPQKAGTGTTPPSFGACKLQQDAASSRVPPSRDAPSSRGCSSLLPPLPSPTLPAGVCKGVVFVCSSEVSLTEQILHLSGKIYKPGVVTVSPESSRVAENPNVLIYFALKEHC